MGPDASVFIHYIVVFVIDLLGEYRLAHGTGQDLKPAAVMLVPSVSALYHGASFIVLRRDYRLLLS